MNDYFDYELYLPGKNPSDYIMVEFFVMHTKKNRSDDDYAPFTVFREEDVVAMVDGMKDFVETVSCFIRSRYQG